MNREADFDPLTAMLNEARNFATAAAAVGSPMDRAIARMLNHADPNNMHGTMSMLTERRKWTVQWTADSDTADHAARVYRAAQEYGGSFAHAWGAAMQTAHGREDWPTLHALRRNFPDLWTEYADERWTR